MFFKNIFYNGVLLSKNVYQCVYNGECLMVFFLSVSVYRCVYNGECLTVCFYR